jgi:hypothetical protein
MRNQPTLSILTLINLAILLSLTLSRIERVQASSDDGMLRGRGLLITDAQGKVRASITVLPAGPGRKSDGSLVDGGKIVPETVLFRLIRPDGRPSVKIATTEQGSGLDLGGGIDPTYIVINADGGDPSLTLTNNDGKRQVVKP